MTDITKAAEENKELMDIISSQKGVVKMEIRESQRMYLLERERLEPPCLTEDQERIGELYQIIADAEDEIERQMDIRAQARDKLRDLGIAV